MSTAAKTRFVSVPSDRLLEELRVIGEAVSKRGGSYEFGRQGREVVYDLHCHGFGKHIVRVYTSLSAGAQSVRECGEDAIRIVVGWEVDGKFKPLRPSRKVLRTAPQGPDEERVNAFLGRLRNLMREAYRQAAEIPACPKCRAAMALRKSKNGKFWGCTSFPECRGTRPAK
jgi:hypothetical protein